MKLKYIVYLLVIGLLFSRASFAEFPEGDLNYLGYSDEMTEFVDEELGLTSPDVEEEDDEEDDDEDICVYITDDEDEENSNIFSHRNQINRLKEEVDSTVEQLKELGVSRSLKSDMKDQSVKVRNKNSNFWNSIKEKGDFQANSSPVSEKTKNQIKNNISKALTDNGFKIVRLDIYSLPEYSTKNAVRAVIKRVKPMKSGSYNEVQNMLNNIKEICLKAATINNHQMLSEMTTFIAENPKNKYYYEKTILR